MVIRVLSALFVVCMAAISPMANGKPTRSECIVGFALDWTQVGMNTNVIAAAMNKWRTQDKSNGVLAGLMLNSGGSRLYLQYRNRCEEKSQMATAMIRIWESQGLDLPTFEFLPDPITPSINTIDLQGEDWR